MHHDPVGANLGWHAQKHPPRWATTKAFTGHDPALPMYQDPFDVHGSAPLMHHGPVAANLGWHAQKLPTKVGNYQCVRLACMARHYSPIHPSSRSANSSACSSSCARISSRMRLVVVSLSPMKLIISR